MKKTELMERQYLKIEADGRMSLGDTDQREEDSGLVIE